MAFSERQLTVIRAGRDAGAVWFIDRAGRVVNVDADCPYLACPGKVKLELSDERDEDGVTTEARAIWSAADSPGDPNRAELLREMGLEERA